MSVARTRRKLMKFERAAVRYNKLVRYQLSDNVNRVTDRFYRVRYFPTDGHRKAYWGVSYQKRWAPIGIRQPWKLKW